MRLLAKRVLITAAVLGLAACSNLSMSDAVETADPGVGAAAICTEDAGVLTPIGPHGCAANQTIVYRKPLAIGSSGSGITTAAGTAASGGSSSPGPTTLQPAMITACTDKKCDPGQVAVVSFQPLGGASTTDGGASDDAPASGDGATDVVDGGALTTDGGAHIADGSVALTPDGGAHAADGGTTPASDGDAALPSADASTSATASDDAGVIGIPCRAVVTCIDPPPTCPAGQSPSYTPSGRWHCMPLCGPNDSNTVVITYGGTYGSTQICAGAPPTTACPNSGQVWTWDFNNEEWVCQDECDNGQYDQHVYDGQTVCVPC